MPLRNFPAIIQGLARLAGVQLDDGLVETIVQDTGTRDALPLLALRCAGSTSAMAAMAT